MDIRAGTLGCLRISFILCPVAAMALAAEPAYVHTQSKLELPPGFGRFMGWYRWIYGCAGRHPVPNEGFQHVGLVKQTSGKMETVHPTLFSFPLLLSAVFLFSFPVEPKRWYLDSKGVWELL